MGLALWLIVGIIAFVTFMAVFKSQDLMFILVLVKKNLFLVFTISIILFACFSLYSVTVGHGIDFGSYEGFIQAGKLYLLWLKSVFVNMGRITGYAVEQDWVLNSTNVTS